MSCIWISHVTHMNAANHTYKWVMSHIGMRPSQTYESDLAPKLWSHCLCVSCDIVSGWYRTIALNCGDIVFAYGVYKHEWDQSDIRYQYESDGDKYMSVTQTQMNETLPWLNKEQQHNILMFMSKTPIHSFLCQVPVLRSDCRRPSQFPNRQKH